MTRYVFDSSFNGVPSLKGADPQRVGKALDKVRLDHDGELRPPDVVEAASAPRHALHPYFEWDDAKAAHAHRLDQARAIIRSIKIVADDETDEEARPAFLSVRDAGAGQRTAYRQVDEVLNSARLRLAVLRRAEADLLAWRTRFRALRDLVELLDPTLKELRRRIDDEDRPSI